MERSKDLQDFSWHNQQVPTHSSIWMGWFRTPSGVRLQLCRSFSNWRGAILPCNGKGTRVSLWRSPNRSWKTPKSTGTGNGWTWWSPQLQSQNPQAKQWSCESCSSSTSPGRRTNEIKIRLLKKFTIKPGESAKHADHWTGRYRIIKLHPGVPKATIQSATDPKAMSRIVHFDQIKSEPYPIGEIQPRRENTGQDVIISPRWEIAEERRKKETENDPKVMPELSNSSGPIDQLEGRPMSKRQRKRMRRRQIMKQRNAINQAKKQQSEPSNELPPKQPYVTQFRRTIRRPKRYDNCYAVQNQNLPTVWHQQPNRRK